MTRLKQQNEELIVMIIKNVYKATKALKSRVNEILRMTTERIS